MNPIKKHRKEKKMSLRALADKAGVVPESVRQWENDGFMSTLQSLIEVSEALGVDKHTMLDELYDWRVSQYGRF